MKKKKWRSGFTLVEMLIVLFIISALSLLIIPNITKTTEKVNDDSRYALTQVIQTQASLYNLETRETATLETLLQNGYITQEQFNKANGWSITVQ